MGIDNSNPYIHSTTVLCDTIPAWTMSMCVSVDRVYSPLEWLLIEYVVHYFDRVEYSPLLRV